MGGIKGNAGFLLLAFLLLVFNEFTFAYFVESPPLSDHAIVAVRILDAVLILGLLGLLVSRFGVPSFVFLPLAGCFVALLAVEVVLRTSPGLHQLQRDDPSYIPFYLKKADLRIESDGGYLTEDGFRTWNSEIKSLLGALKNDVGCKVVVLGDSFVKGAGVPASETWPAKLSQQINCHVYPFGRSGWSSMEQFQYYHENLSELDFDYLLVGVVSNDPHPNGNFCGYNYPDDDYRRYQFSFLQPLGLVGRALRRSFALDYMDQVLDNAVSPHLTSKGTLSSLPIESWGYGNWEQRLYEDDVFSLWQATVDCFLKSAKHTTAFVLTPTTISNRQEIMFDKISGVMESIGAKFINGYPELKEMYGDGGRPRSDWANAADSHPGQRQNSLYATLARALLEEIDTEQCVTDQDLPECLLIEVME